MELKKKIQLTNTQKRAQRKNAKKEQKKSERGREREEWKKVIVPCQQGKDIELHTHVVC